MGWYREDFEALTIEAVGDYGDLRIECKDGWSEEINGVVPISDLIEKCRVHTNKCEYEGE